MANLIEKIKERKNFSQMPDSLIEKALLLSNSDEKETKSLLRKYFGVFLTNRIMKAKDESVLKYHFSTKKRDYNSFYKNIFEGIENVGSVLDLGCGVNGFSYNYLEEAVGKVDYIGVEAIAQLKDLNNIFFKKKNLEGFCNVLSFDLFNLKRISDILEKTKKPRVVFLFQVVDALEIIEKDFSKQIISKVLSKCELLVITLPTESLGGKKKFFVQRKWLIDFLKDNFLIKKDFVLNGERILVISKN